MIRRHFHISKIAGSLTVLLALVSCASEDLFDSTALTGSQNMSLQVVTSDNAVTRTTPGDITLNEDRFVALDYYFFSENNDTQVLKLHKSEGVRLESGNNTLDISSHTYNGRLSEEDIIAIWGSSVETGSCYVYVLANLFTDTRTSINAASNLTLGNLKQFSFQDTNISADAKQECFVMFGGGMVSLTKDETTGVKTIAGNPIRVTRDAAKIELTVTNIEEYVETIGEDGETVVSRWKSMTDNVWVMFYEGVNKSNVHSQINEGLHYLPNLNDDSEDCYFDLTSKNSKWRKLTAIDSNQPNKYLKHEFPFYTYLADWREGSGYEDHASYMILVVPWQQVDPTTNEPISGTPRYTYYQIKTSETDTYYENYYYRININVGVLGSFELPEPKQIEGTYMIVPWGEVGVDATMREPIYLIVETNHYTMNNVSTGSVPYLTSHDLTQAYVSKVEYKALKNFNTVTRTNGTAGLNTIFQTNTYVNNERFQVSTADGKVTLTHNISPEQYTRYDVTVRIRNSKGLEEEIVFTIYPAIYVDKQDGGNAFVNGYFGNVINPPSSNSWYRNTNNDTSYRVRQNTGNNPTHIWAGGAYNQNSSTNAYGSLITGDPGLNTTLTRIKVTSFSENDEKFQINIERNNGSTTEEYTYKITDPRVSSGWTSNDLYPYVVTASSRYDIAYTTQTWDDAGSIMVGTTERDKIAPEFLVTSAWGRCNPNSVSFDIAKKRCATYQEAGYPAGRWRLPTVAEISYIYTLQEKGVIDNLFNPGHDGGYWSSEGYAVRYRNSHPSLRLNYTGTDPIRCVYDVWYWGDTPKTTNEFHAMPTN